jgi:hypothetical protein
MKTSYEFKKVCLVFLTVMLIFSLSGCSSSDNNQAQGYPIDSDVQTTDQRMLSFSMDFTPDTTKLSQVSQYDTWGYGIWTFGAPLPVEARTDSTTFGIMPDGYVVPTLPPKAKLLNFFAITDIHITDKEAPNQIIYLQQLDPTYSGTNTSIYSPIMMYTTQVLDAAIQTANALHKKKAFDFGISLGDTCNNTSYKELRWYIDVIDGKVIIPSSGAHVGASTIETLQGGRAQQGDLLVSGSRQPRSLLHWFIPRRCRAISWYPGFIHQRYCLVESGFINPPPASPYLPGHVQYG